MGRKRGDRRTERIVGPASPIYLVGAALNAEDELTSQIILLDFVHHEIHEGDTFQASQKTADDSPIADDADYEMLIVTGDVAEAHFVFASASAGTAEMLFYEDTVVSALGTQLDVQNMRRILHGVNLNTTMAYETPTVTNDGLQLANVLLPGGTGPGMRTSGATIREDTEWNLKVNTNYLIRLTNRSGSAQPMSIMAQWYEEVADN